MADEVNDTIAATEGLNPALIVLFVIGGLLITFIVGNYALYMYAQKTLPQRKKKPVSKKKLKREKMKQGVSAPGERLMLVTRGAPFELGGIKMDQRLASEDKSKSKSKLRYAHESSGDYEHGTSVLISTLRKNVMGGAAYDEAHGLLGKEHMGETVKGNMSSKIAKFFTLLVARHL
ncbi:hypothetical protein ACFE04_020498 [Oxalis oulophora]